MTDSIIKFEEFLKSNIDEKNVIQSTNDNLIDVDLNIEDNFSDSNIEDNFSDFNLTEKRINYLMSDFGISQEELNSISSVTEEKNIVENNQIDDFYNLYRDVNENFTCDIFIEGANIENSKARLILESDDWNLIFNGKIENGKCVIPVKKLEILKENLVGNIKLEVIAENNIFVPWENKFRVKSSKRVSILNEKISITK